MSHDFPAFLELCILRSLGKATLHEQRPHAPGNVNILFVKQVSVVSSGSESSTALEERDKHFQSMA